MEQTFEQWMKALDKRVRVVSGVSVHDLEDQPFRAWFDDGMAVNAAATEALDYSGFYD